jgi:hypothetical protein
VLVGEVEAVAGARPEGAGEQRFLGVLEAADHPGARRFEALVEVLDGPPDGRLAVSFAETEQDGDPCWGPR